MSKFDEERLYKIRCDLQSELPQVLIFTDFEGTYIHIIYDGESVCKIRTDKNSYGYKVTFTSEFSVNGHETTQWFPGYRSISASIRNAICKYKERQEVKNMANRRFIVEKMEIEQKCGEPDVINMTVRQEPDGIPFQTGKELRTLIESLDPDKLSSDNRTAVAIDISNDAIINEIHMMTARGSGKTRWISEMLKNSFPFKDHIKDVIFNDPATIVFWVDGSKTVVKCQKGETFDPEKGLAMAISKKVLGNDYSYYETFAKHVGRYYKRNRKKYIKAIDDVLSEIAPDEIIRNGVVYKRVEETDDGADRETT